MRGLALGIGVLGFAAAIAAPAAADPIKIVMVIHGSTANEFWQPVKKGFEDACGKIQADCQMLFTNTNMSVQEELTNVDAALATNPDALILTIPDNNAFTKVVADARAKGIIVIAINNDDVTPGHNARQSYIGPAFLASGIALTKQLETLFPKEGPINVLLGVNVPGANWSEQRAAGVVKALGRFQGGQSGTQAHGHQTGCRRRSRHDIGSRRRLSQRASRHDRLYRDGLARRRRGAYVEGPRHSARKDHHRRVRRRVRRPAGNEVRLHPGSRRPAALHAGLHAGHGSLSGEDGRPCAFGHRHRKRLVLPSQADSIAAMAAKGLR